MNKKTIFKLFLTTILSTGAAFASDPTGDDSLFSPGAKGKLATLESTPQMEARAREAISDDLFSPGSIDYHRDLFVTQAKHQRDDQREGIVKASRSKALQARMAAAKQAEDEENQRQIEALAHRLQALSLSLTDIKSEKSGAEREVLRAAEAEKLLTARIAALESERLEAERKAEQARITAEEQIALKEAETLRLISAKEEETAKLIEEKERAAALLVDAQRDEAARQIAVEKEEAAKLIAAEKAEAARQIEAEKAKRTAVMAASREALEAMDKRLAESKKQVNVLAEERDDLESTAALLKAREAGLQQQIKIFNRHLDEMSSVATDADGVDRATLGGRDSVMSTPASRGVGGSGGHSGASAQSNVSVLPKASFKAKKQPLQ